METLLLKVKDKLDEVAKISSLEKEKPIVGKSYYLDNSESCSGIYVGLNENYRQAFKDIVYYNNDYGQYAKDQYNWVTMPSNRNLKPVKNG